MSLSQIIIFFGVGRSKPPKIYLISQKNEDSAYIRLPRMPMALHLSFLCYFLWMVTNSIPFLTFSKQGKKLQECFSKNVDVLKQYNWFWSVKQKNPESGWEVLIVCKYLPVSYVDKSCNMGEFCYFIYIFTWYQ